MKMLVNQNYWFPHNNLYFVGCLVCSLWTLVAHGGPLRSPWLDENLLDDYPATEAAEGKPSASGTNDSKTDASATDQELGLDADSFQPYPAEMRDQFTRGASLNLGVTDAWQAMGAEVYWQHHQWYGTSVSVGFGEWIIKGRTGATEYRVDVISRAARFGWRYFLHETLPLYLQPVAGLVVLTGDMTPSGVDAADFGTVSFLRAGFRSYGLTYGVNLGSMAMWENRFYLDYSLVGLAGTSILSLDSSATSSVTNSEIKAQLKKPQIWGLINLKIGWQF